jgi:Domain of unknown function (DUF4868)
VSVEQRDVALAAASTFDEYETHVVVLTQRPKRVPELFRLNLTDTLAAQFRSLAHKVGRGLQQRTVVEYSAGRLLAGYELVWISTARAPVFTSIQDQLSHPEDLPILDPRTKVATHMKMYFLVIKRPERDVYFFATLNPSARLARGGRLAAMFSNGTFDTLKREVLVFEPRLDGVIIDTFIFTTKTPTTERLLGILAEIEAVATEAFESVTENLSIKNLDEFRAAATRDIHMMRKFGSIAEKIASNPAYLEAMAMDKILAFLEERPHIDIDIEGSGSDARFVFYNDPKRRWRILHLLDDDYLHSPLTELDYESNSKNLLKPRQGS